MAMKLNYSSHSEMLEAVKELNEQGFKFRTDYINFILTIVL